MGAGNGKTYKLLHTIRNKKQLDVCLQQLPDKIFIRNCYGYYGRDNFTKIKDKPGEEEQGGYYIDVPEFTNYRWMLDKTTHTASGLRNIVFLFMMKSVFYTPIFVADYDNKTYNLNHFVNPKAMTKIRDSYEHSGDELGGVKDKHTPSILKNLPI